jgi:hypothetical protein
MSAQLKPVVLIKEAIKPPFYRRVEYLEHQHLWVQLENQNVQKQRIVSDDKEHHANHALFTVSTSTVKRQLRDACLLASLKN